MSVIEIDLNVRVRNDETFSAFRHIHGAVPSEGDLVDVIEPECGLGGSAVVTEVNYVKGIIYLAVEWASLRETLTTHDGPVAVVSLFGAELAAVSAGVTYGSGSSYNLGSTRRYASSSDPELAPA